jgi:hypothetical protein
MQWDITDGLFGNVVPQQDTAHPKSRLSSSGSACEARR